MEEKTIWGFHARESEDKRLLKGYIAIGWEELGDLSSVPADKEEYKKIYAKAYPEASKQSIATSISCVYRFINEAQIGDIVVYPSKSDRMINIGIIEGNYEYNQAAQAYPNERKVKWVKHLPRTDFSQGALYETGAFISFFKIKTYSDEFIAALEGKKIVFDEDETVAVTAEEIQEGTRDFIIKNLKKQLKGYDLEDFVANLLNAMGYRCKTSAHGGDHGIDIIAYKDELPPRIIVQVKSVDSDITEEVLKSFKGSLLEGDYGLFVTLSNFKPNAQKVLDNNPRMKGISGKELTDLILKYYDLLDDKYQDIIPLKKVYIPVIENE